MGSSAETVVVACGAGAGDKAAAGTAAILAIGTANPSGVMYQKDFADYYFDISSSNHMVALKQKFERICEKTMIEKRHRFLTDEAIRENPSIVTYDGASLDVRQEMCDVEIPLLGSEAAMRAVRSWGRPISGITHLVVCNSGAAAMPGADFDIVRLLGLPGSTKRFMLYQTGCFGGGTVLRLAKDLAENNPGARLLAICCEIMSISFRGPCETDLENLISQALLGDGAGAVIMGADVHAGVERAIFEIASASQRILPGSDGGIVGKLREAGLMVTLQPQVPVHISANVENIVREALKPLGVKDDLQQLFWVVHPGGAAILDKMEQKLGLKGANKFWASREVLRQFGNMASPSVIFAKEVMKKRSEEQGMITAGEGLEWGVLLGFGPGITVETVVLRCPMT